MTIFAVDDEPKMLRLLHRAVEEAAPEAEILDFSRASEVLRAVSEGGSRPEVIFMDICLPGMDGLELAVRVKNLTPDTRIIFVTAFSKYAVEAYRLHINGYIMKPVLPERVREELELLSQPRKEADPGKLRVQCFGYFDVFWKGTPLVFSRTQTRELFAYLIDREGGVCTAGEIIDILWEDDEKIKNPKQYLRVLTQDLRSSLASVGMERVLIREHNQWAVRKELIDCDYYRMLEGDPAAVNAYHGEYMRQYSWAELTAAKLHFRRT